MSKKPYKANKAINQARKSERTYLTLFIECAFLEKKQDEIEKYLNADIDESKVLWSITTNLIDAFIPLVDTPNFSKIFELNKEISNFESSDDIENVFNERGLKVKLFDDLKIVFNLLKADYEKWKERSFEGKVLSRNEKLQLETIKQEKFIEKSENEDEFYETYLNYIKEQIQSSDLEDTWKSIQSDIIDLHLIVLNGFGRDKVPREQIIKYFDNDNSIERRKEELRKEELRKEYTEQLGHYPETPEDFKKLNLFKIKKELREEKESAERNNLSYEEIEQKYNKDVLESIKEKNRFMHEVVDFREFTRELIPHKNYFNTREKISEESLWKEHGVLDFEGKNCWAFVEDFLRFNFENHFYGNISPFSLLILIYQNQQNLTNIKKSNDFQPQNLYTIIFNDKVKKVSIEKLQQLVDDCNSINTINFQRQIPDYVKLIELHETDVFNKLSKKQKKFLDKEKRMSKKIDLVYIDTMHYLLDELDKKYSTDIFKNEFYNQEYVNCLKRYKKIKKDRSFPQSGSLYRYYNQ